LKSKTMDNISKYSTTTPFSYYQFSSLIFRSRVACALVRAALRKLINKVYTGDLRLS
jgi:hypothetical protein